MKHAPVALALALGACGQGATVEAAGGEGFTLAPRDLPAFFDCLRERGQTVVGAHRGGPAPGFPENAVATFARTLAEAPALVEIDVARTRDGVLVLMHDDSVERTTTGAGVLADLAYAEVSLLRLEDADGRPTEARVPTLREALRWAAGKTVLELDIKRGVAYEDVVGEAREAGAAGRVILIAHSLEAALRLAELAPEMMISVPIDDIADLDALEDAGVALSHVLAWTGTDAPSAQLNLALAARGVEVAFGALGEGASDGADDYGALAEAGNQLIATDRPAAAARDLDAHDGVAGHGALQCVT